MVGFPLRGLEGVEAFACLEVATIITAGRPAAAAMPALPIRNRRRDGEGSAVGALDGTADPGDRATELSSLCGPGVRNHCSNAFAAKRPGLQFAGVR